VPGIGLVKMPAEYDRLRANSLEDGENEHPGFIVSCLLHCVDLNGFGNLSPEAGINCL
jgi:hypothetical protein